MVAITKENKVEFPCGICLVKMVCKDPCKKIRDSIGGLLGCRYSEFLIKALSDETTTEILYLDYTDDYQGHVNIIAKTFDGRIIKYSYNYGSCSGCDTWEAEDLSDQQIIDEMKREMTKFSSEEVYLNWVKQRKEDGKGFLWEQE